MTEAQAAAVKDLKLWILRRKLREIADRLTVATYNELYPDYQRLQEQIKNIENYE